MVEVVLLFYSLEGDGPFIACLDPLQQASQLPAQLELPFASISCLTAEVATW